MSITCTNLDSYIISGISKYTSNQQCGSNPCITSNSPLLWDQGAGLGRCSNAI